MMTVRISLAFLNRQERAATAKDIIELYKNDDHEVYQVYFCPSDNQSAQF
jgi:hypothetical protein